MQDTFVLSHQHPHSNSGSPVPTVVSSSSEPIMNSNFGAQLHPHNWMGPTSVPWDALGTVVGGYGYDSGS
jgi:hypothetical protein